MNTENALRSTFESWYRERFDWPEFPAMPRNPIGANEEETRLMRLSGLRPGEYQSLECEICFRAFVGGYAEDECQSVELREQIRTACFRLRDCSKELSRYQPLTAVKARMDRIIEDLELKVEL